MLTAAVVGCQKNESSKTPDGGSEPTFPTNPAPSGFVYTQNNLMLNKGKTLVGIFPSYFGSPTTFSISPSLPAGLSLNTSNGVISGTPTVEQAETDYIVTASNSFGSDEAELKITVQWALPVLVKSNLKVGGGALLNRISGTVNNLLLFGNNTAGGQLLVSSGTEASTSLIKQFDGANGYSPQGFTKLNNTTSLFVADSIATGIELYKTDGTGIGTTLVKDIRVGANGSLIKNLVVSGTLVYFLADDGSGGGFQLYKTDGTTAGTVKLTNFANEPMNLIDHDGVLFFVVDDGSIGEEVYMTTGSSPTLVANLSASSSAEPRLLTSVGDYVYFKADSGMGEGSELYRTDGLVIELVDDIVPGAVGSSIDFIFNFNGRALFSAYDSTNGRELWISDDNSTNLVSDLNTGTGNGSPNNLTIYNEQVFMMANRADTGVELYKTDGSTTTLVSDINAGSFNSNPNSFIVVNNLLFFMASNQTVGNELYRLDLSDNLILVENLTSGSASSSLVQFNNINNKLFFFKHDIINDNYDLYTITP